MALRAPLIILLFVLTHLPSDYTTLLITAGQCFYCRRINMAMETGVGGFAIERQSSFDIQERITNTQFNCQSEQEDNFFAFIAKTVR